MSIDLSKVTAISDQYGSYAKIEDASGRVLWMVPSASVPIVLEVEKITSDTYAAETTYTGEQFILLDIYPKTNGTVKVTYGGLTKTITDTSGAEEPNAQQVFFGTFNGVSDSVATPASGTLTIEGDCCGFGCSKYSKSNKLTSQTCNCVTAINSFGNIEIVPAEAFFNCAKITKAHIPSGVMSVGIAAFCGCTALTSVTIPATVTSIGYGVFNGCTSLSSIVVDSNNNYYSAESGVLFNKDKTLLHSYPAASGHYTVPASVNSIHVRAFYNCNGLMSVTIPASVTSIGLLAFFLSSGYARTVAMLSATPPTLDGDNVFDMPGTNNIVLKNGGIETYKAAEYWSEYADYITEAS